MANVVQLPNFPLTHDLSPMALLPPEIVSQKTIVTVITSGSAAVLIWDVLDNICSEYKLISQFKIGIPTVVYFTSRFASLYYVLTYTIINAAAIPWSCSSFSLAIAIGFPVAVSATSLLFFLRVKAIFNNDKRIIIFFACLFLLVLASTITVPFGVSAINVGPTNYCVFNRFESYANSAAIVPLVYDTLVFLAIWWRLTRDVFDSYDLNLRTWKGIKTVVSGNHLPALSRSLLQDGQVYYLSTVTTGLANVIMLFVPGIPNHILRVMLTVPNLTLMNIMACRVFRNTKLGSGITDSDSITTSMIYAEYDLSISDLAPDSRSSDASTRRGSRGELRSISHRSQQTQEKVAVDEV